MAIGGVAAGRTGTGEDTTYLGRFDDGLDGWKTTGGNELSRVSDEEMPVAVTAGEYALAVEVRGDRHPLIENVRRVKNADFDERPYLLTHVIGIAEETDSDLVFRYRLHHTASPEEGDGSSDTGEDDSTGDGGSQGGSGPGDGGGGSGGKDVLVEESEERRIPQLRPQHLRWNLGDVDEAKLESAKRLEIAWYLADHPPDRNQRGHARGDFEYHGTVAFDGIRLTADVAGAEALASRDKKLELHRRHGMLLERNVEERREGHVRGTLVFGDGAEIPYEFEVLAEGRFRYTIDGETFALGGDGA